MITIPIPLIILAFGMILGVNLFCFIVGRDYGFKEGLKFLDDLRKERKP